MENKDPLYGRKWKNTARFKTFELADKDRKKRLKEKNLQVKVKKLKEFYIVKTRSTVVDAARNKSARKSNNFYKKKKRESHNDS